MIQTNKVLKRTFDKLIKRHLTSQKNWLPNKNYRYWNKIPTSVTGLVTTAALNTKFTKIENNNSDTTIFLYTIMVTRKVKINSKDIQQSPNYNILYNRGKIKMLK